MFSLPVETPQGQDISIYTTKRHVIDSQMVIRWSLKTTWVKFAWSVQEDVWLFPDDASFEEVLDNTDRCLSGHVGIGCVLLFLAFQDFRPAELTTFPLLGSVFSW